MDVVKQVSRKIEMYFFGLSVLKIYSFIQSSSSFVKDEKRGHDDVSGVFVRIGIVSFEQAKVDDVVGAFHVQLEEDGDKLSEKLRRDYLEVTDISNNKQDSTDKLLLTWSRSIQI